MGPGNKSMSDSMQRGRANTGAGRTLQAAEMAQAGREAGGSWGFQGRVPRAWGVLSIAVPASPVESPATPTMPNPVAMPWPHPPRLLPPVNPLSSPSWPAPALPLSSTASSGHPKPGPFPGSGLQPHLHLCLPGGPCPFPGF